jgi:transposase
MDSSQPSSNRRRRHSATFKRQVVEQTLQSGASVAAIALEHGLNANLLHKWRRQYRRAAQQRLDAPAALVAVDLAPSPAPPLTPTAASSRPADGQIEIACGRLRVRISGRIEPETLRAVLGVLERP